jgi:hypothetical protein
MKKTVRSMPIKPQATFEVTENGPSGYAGCRKRHSENKRNCRSSTRAYPFKGKEILSAHMGRFIVKQLTERGDLGRFSFQRTWNGPDQMLQYVRRVALVAGGLDRKRALTRRYETGNSAKNTVQPSVNGPKPDDGLNASR